ncbi:unnamed protein product [Rotaria sordida]|uniref:F-box domain-containing protein n=1 Tax=Rotaria sordida TaxID=392033 RepID=A0A819TKN2_9BILA|nr:unnamed protein product [Rotaria sordida]
MVHSPLDQLPILVLHTLFTYLLTEEILFSLLNVSTSLNDAIKSYSNYRLNFKSILRSNFDLICQHILPNQVKALILSDDQHTPGQSQLFLSHFQIDEFINLQSLTLIEIEKKSLEIINEHLYKLNRLRSFLFKSEINILFSMSFVNLHHLELSQCSLNLLENICLTTPWLKTLNVTVIHETSNFEFQCQLNYSVRSMNEIEKFLLNFPCLKHLELSTRIHDNFVTGHQLEILSKDLITLKFIFKITLLHSIEETLDTFRTSFWLEEKCWFVAYENNYLYTVPCSMYTHINEHFQSPKYSTLLKNSIFYDNIIKLTLYVKLIETCHRLNNITTLEIGYENISIETLSAIVNLSRIMNLTLPSSMNKSKIKYLLNKMPRLQYLSIDTLMSNRTFEEFQNSGRNFLDNIQDLQLKQIRELKISDYHIIDDSYTIDRLCYIFPSIERLHVSIGQLNTIVQLINCFQYLSIISLNLKYLSDKEKEYFALKSELIIDQIRQMMILTYKYQMTNSCLHLWIKKESEEIIRKIDQRKKRECFWYWCNFILSQRSLLSMIVTVILINHLLNILLCMWNYILSDIPQKTSYFSYIFNPSAVLLITQVCSTFFKKHHRTFVYLFGYIFVWIFTIIAWIFPDWWHLISIDTVSLSVLSSEYIQN